MHAHRHMHLDIMNTNQKPNSKVIMGAGETAQWSRVLAVLIEDLGLVHSSYARQLTTTLEFKGFAAFF